MAQTINREYEEKIAAAVRRGWERTKSALLKFYNEHEDKIDLLVNKVPGKYVSVGVVLALLMFLAPLLVLRFIGVTLTLWEYLSLVFAGALIVGIFAPGLLLRLVPFAGDDLSEKTWVRGVVRSVSFAGAVFRFDGDETGQLVVILTIVVLLGLAAFAAFKNQFRGARGLALAALVFFFTLYGEAMLTYRTVTFEVRGADLAKSQVSTDLGANGGSLPGETFENLNVRALGKVLAPETQGIFIGLAEKRARVRAGVIGLYIPWWGFNTGGLRRNLIWWEPASNPEPTLIEVWIRLFGFGNIPLEDEGGA